ncbi:MAG: transcriptional regulator [Pseudomonadota bacterium]
MPRGDQLGRQWKIIQAITVAMHGKTAAELADEIECNLRTVYRDLEALQIAGFPLYNSRDEGKSLWVLSETVKNNTPIPFSMTELMALYFSKDLIKALQDTLFHDSLESLFQKIKTTLPPESLKYLQSVQQTFTVGKTNHKRYRQFKDIIPRVNEAVLKKKTVAILYHAMSSKKDTARNVDPYRIWFFNGTFYLVGHCHLRKEIRIFALDRVVNLSITDEEYTIPEDFDFEDLMSGSFGAFHGTPEKVRVHFAASIAGYIEEKVWHNSQKISQQDDGSIIFEAFVAVNRELKFWILSWGAKAYVLEPDSLKEEIKTEATGIAESYL